MTDDDALRRAWSAGAGTRVGAAKDDERASDDAIWSAMHGALPTRDAAREVARALTDDDVLVALRVAAAFADSPADVVAVRPDPAQGRAWSVLVAVAAALVLVWVAWPVPRSERPIELRAADESGITAEDDVTWLRDDCVLRWQSPRPDGVFSLRVTTDEPALVIEVDRIEATHHRIPSDRLRGIEAGTTLIWQVEQVLPDGSRLRSPTFRGVLW